MLFWLIFTFLLNCVIFGSLMVNSKKYDVLNQAPRMGIGLQYHNEVNVTEKLYNLLREYHEFKIRQYYQKRKYWTTSNLGYSMFKNNINYKNFKGKNGTFVIFIWKYWYDWFKKRHMFNHVSNNPLDDCSVKNCVITTDYSEMYLAHAVVVNVRNGFVPYFLRRNPSQRWVFLSDEPPKYIFVDSNPMPNLKNWANIFNWTMTYRTDSDVPVPYGRTLSLSPKFSPTETPESIADLVPFWKTKRRDVLISALISSCGVTERMEYIKKLEKYITVDVYGQCSQNNKNSCPGRYTRDCPILNDYVFYLAFENSGCRQYITEKTFYNSFSKGAIPIIMGPPKGDCYKLLPPHSFIHVKDFASPKALSDYIRKLNMNEDKLLMYHQWRRFFRVVNEHGYSGTKSYSICRLCEALNFNDEKPKMYGVDDLKLFIDFKILCQY